MVRRDEAGLLRRTVSRRSSPAGASPVSVSAGAPSSRPRASGEIRMTQAGCQEPLRREQVRGPQPYVKPAASTHLQSESRAGHVAAKAMSTGSQSGDHAVGLGGVRGAARGHGIERNARGPSAQPWSGRRGWYKPTAKASRAQRESEGAVVLTIIATKNAMGGKGLCFGHARNEGTCQGMAGKTGPNSPVAPQRDVNAQQPRPALWTPAKPPCVFQTRRRRDVRRAFGIGTSLTVHAGSGRPSVSRVPEIGTHGLKGGPALSPMQFNV
jgi:hypothetical protein